MRTENQNGLKIKQILAVSASVVILALVIYFPYYYDIFGFNSEGNLVVFAGAASQPPSEEVAAEFKKSTGTEVTMNFGGSGTMLSQIELSKTGDVYFPGSSDYIEKAKEKKIVYPETEKIVAYLVPVICVKKGNPENIKGLRDFLRPGIRIIIGNPESVCLGSFAVEIFEKNFNSEEIVVLRNNIINYAGSCEKATNSITLGAADAIIGWHVFQYWEGSQLDVVKLNPEELVRVSYLSAAVTVHTKDKSKAESFIDFLISDKAKDIFREYHYFMTEQEVFDYVGAVKPVGGSYKVPENWIDD